VGTLPDLPPFETAGVEVAPGDADDEPGPVDVPKSTGDHD
jgi:hypothetical protein